MTDQAVAEFRANGGRLGGPLAGTPVLLLHHVGARTGTSRITPLAYSCHGDRLVIVASNGGAPGNPAWLHNLRAHPDVAVELGTDLVPVHATEPTGPDRDQLWQEAAARYPDLTRFQARTPRPIPLMVLRRRRPSATGAGAASAGDTRDCSGLDPLVGHDRRRDGA